MKAYTRFYPGMPLTIDQIVEIQARPYSLLRFLGTRVLYNLQYSTFGIVSVFTYPAFLTGPCSQSNLSETLHAHGCQKGAIVSKKDKHQAVLACGPVLHIFQKAPFWPGTKISIKPWYLGCRLSKPMKFAYILPVLAGAVQATVSLDFNVLRGKDAREFAQTHKTSIGLSKRDNTLDVPLDNAATFYLTTLKVGSDKQEVQVLVDTGSSDLWFATSPCSESQLFSWKKREDEAEEESDEEDEADETPTPTTESFYTGFITGADSLIPKFSSFVSYELANNPIVSLGENASNYYYATEACTAYGSFATGSSDSFKPNKTEDPFYISYGDYSYALGYWASDDIEIGGQVVDGLSFGVAPYTDSSVGVLGIGLPGLEGTVRVLHPNRSYEYENLPLRLKNLGIIQSNSYSVWLGKNNVSQGSVLFGGLDTSRFTGPLTKLPIINEYSKLGVEHPIRTNVLLNGISGDNVDVDYDVVALLDTGTTLAYLPQVYIDPLVEKTNGVYDEGQYNVSCDVLSSKEEISFKFSGIDIKVPLGDLIFQVNGYDTSEGCVLGVLDGGNKSAILGDVFLKSAYAVFDFDNYEIALAQAAGEEKQEKEGSNIVTISNGIPSASSAPFYSATTLSDVLYYNTSDSLYFYSTSTFGEHTTVAAESVSSNWSSNGTGHTPWYHSDSGSGKNTPAALYAIVVGALGGALSFL